MKRHAAAGRTIRWGRTTTGVAAAALLALTPAVVLSGGGFVSVYGDPPQPERAGLSRSASSFSSERWGDPAVDKVAKAGTGKNSAAADPGSLYTIENSIGARTVWAQKDSGGRQITGQGVTVALLDSGTAAVPGLNGAGKLTHGPDLSVESNGSLNDQDTFGHGTFMAGIIAGRDAATLTDKTVKTLDPAVQLGVAPDARLLSLKLANSDGSSDVSQIIAALNWVTEHQTAPDGSKVRIVNLSFGTDSVQPYQLDPLAAATENAWRHGLVVVVSGGNEGQLAGRLTDPAMDPYVLAVGASDSNESATGWIKPTVASFSSSGNAARHVDLLAPGASLVSLRAPGSFIDLMHPEGLVSGDASGRLFRGSGTSQAAAVVSGAAALLLQAKPSLTPDQVKAALVGTATPVAADAIYAGAGQLNIASAVLAVRNTTTVLGTAVLSVAVQLLATQTYPVSTGQGSLDAARGGSGLLDVNGIPISGEIDAQGNPWRPAAWWLAASSLSSWSGGSWMGVPWTGDGWIYPSGLSSARWSSARWSSALWSDADWSSARWSSARWSADLWSDADWSSARWSSARWSDSTWN